MFFLLVSVIVWGGGLLAFIILLFWARPERWTFKSFCFIYGMDMYTMYTMYGMPYLEAPLMSLTFMEGCNPSFTIGQWIIIRLVKRFVVILQIYIATYAITNVVMRKMTGGK